MEITAKELGVVDKKKYDVFNKIKNEIIDKESLFIEKTFYVHLDELPTIEEAEQKRISKILSNVFSNKQVNDSLQLCFNKNDIFPIAQEIKNYILEAVYCGTHDCLSINEERAIYLIIEDAFNNNGISIEPLGEKITEYIKSDDLQIVKQDAEDVFSLAEVRTLGDNEFAVVQGTFDLNDFTQEELEEEIHPYGYSSIDEIKSSYGSEYKRIIAECIFENTGIYDTGKSPQIFDSLEKASQALDLIVEKNKNVQEVINQDLRDISVKQAEDYFITISEENTSPQAFAKIEEKRREDFKRLCIKLFPHTTNLNKTVDALTARGFAEMLNRVKRHETQVRNEALYSCKEYSGQKPDNFLQEVISDAVDKLKTKNTLPEIGKALTKVTKDISTQLGKENLINKGR